MNMHQPNASYHQQQYAFQGGVPNIPNGSNWGGASPGISNPWQQQQQQMPTPTQDPSLTHQQQMYQNQLYQQQLYQNQVYQQQYQQQQFPVQANNVNQPGPNTPVQQLRQHLVQSQHENVANSSFQQPKEDEKGVKQKETAPQQQPRTAQAPASDQPTQNADNGKKRTVGVQRGKGRSLADMLNKQIEEGKIDPKEEFMDKNNRYYRNKDFSGPRDQGGRGGGGYRPNRERIQNQNDPWEGGPSENDKANGSSSLNWQQQELLNDNRNGPGYNSSRNAQQPFNKYNNSRGRGGGRGLNNPSYGRQSDGGYRGGYNGRDNGYQQRNGYYNNSNNRQYNQRGGQNNQGWRGNNNNNNNFFGRQNNQTREKDYDNNPEWADDIGTGSNDVTDSSLNWQQQSLVNRDESDPFHYLVRGENDLSRE